MTATIEHGPSAAAPDRRNPYVGPRSFRYGEPIHGRARETTELCDVLVAERIVLLYSPSGAGKSSLVEAGVRPELERRSFRVLPTIRVGHDLPAELRDAAGANRYRWSTLVSLEEGRPTSEQLPTDELAALSLGAYLERTAVDDDLDPCLFFDQFEELLTVDPVDHAAKAAFVADLGQALRDRGRWAVIAMREDFIAQLDPYLGLLPTHLAARYRLDLLGPAAARTAACRPAQEAGVDFAEAAADQLVDDLRTVRVQRGAVATTELGPYVEPVQLQVVCHRLWNSLSPEATSIGVDDVAALGDVDHALADFYDTEVADVAVRTGVAERLVRTWIDEQLISPDGFRTQVLDGPGAAGPDVLHGLEDAHLIRADRRRGADWYELAHDRLVRPVRASNAAWRERHLAEWQRRAEAWRRDGRSDDLLASGALLDQALDWSAAHDDAVVEGEREYLAACVALRRRRRRRRTTVVAVVAILSALAILAGALALVAHHRADDARDAEASALASRNDAESQRSAAQAARDDAESQRNAAQAARDDAESQRNAAQTALQDAQTQRAAAEAAQAQAKAAQQSLAELLGEIGKSLDAPTCSNGVCLGGAASAVRIVSTRADASCESEPSRRSTKPLGQTSFFGVMNGLAAPLSVDWIDFSGQRVPYETIAPGSTADVLAPGGTVWVVTDTAGTCLTVYPPNG